MIKRLKLFDNVKNNRHHIYAVSRFPELKKCYKNIVEVDKELHALHHKQFSNRTPKEIIEYLNTTFWGGRFIISIRGFHCK